jgi:adenosylcobyric acid synthase
MILGTSSHAGKSILTAALGRILSDLGYRVAPFKAQNMSLNSAATPEGLEIGRAQALQAEACRVPARAEMNPVLIKPSTDTASQIVVLGRIWGQLSAADYHTRGVESLVPTVLQSYQTLAAEHDVMVLEGAGSPAEINLRQHDIVNMRMAAAANAACLLVGDIDRGGVFASILGTLELLTPDERRLVRGYAINKFRGDADLLRPGIDMMAPRLGIPCAGVVPFLHDLGLDEEDGVASEDKRHSSLIWNLEDRSPSRPLRVAVLAFPHLANFTDFDPLEAEPSISLAYISAPEELDHADLLILPGSKQTIDDLAWLRERGFERAIQRLQLRGGLIAGICGGFQMLGRSIDDPFGIESDSSEIAAASTATSCPGLGLLALRTVMQPDKTTQQLRGRLLSPFFGENLPAAEFLGYEIHVGETVYEDQCPRFAEIIRQGEAHAAGGSSAAIADGATSPDHRVFGSYVHGLFDQDAIRHAFLDSARAALRLAPATLHAFVAREREARLDRLASHVRQSLDIPLILSWLGLESRK